MATMSNEVTSADGGWRVLFAFVVKRPAAAEFWRWPRDTLWHLMNEKSARCIQFGLMPSMPVTWLVCSP